jgi:hypothetical protein
MPKGRALTQPGMLLLRRKVAKRCLNAAFIGSNKSGRNAFFEVSEAFPISRHEFRPGSSRRSRSEWAAPRGFDGLVAHHALQAMTCRGLLE